MIPDILKGFYVNNMYFYMFNKEINVTNIVTIYKYIYA